MYGGTSYSSLLRSNDGEALIIRDSTTVLEKRCCVIYAIKTTRYLLPLAISPLLSSLPFFVREISPLSLSLERSINPIRNVLQFIRTKKTTRRASFHVRESRSGRSDTKCREVSRAEVRGAKRRRLEEGRKVDLKWSVGETEREKSRFYHRSKVHISVRRIERSVAKANQSSTSTRISLLFRRKLLDLFSRPRATRH